MKKKLVAKFFEILQRMAQVLGALALVCLVVVIVWDVVFRYFFNHPLASSFEASEVLLTLLIFFGICVSFGRDDHIRITIINRFFDDSSLVAKHLTQINGVAISFCSVSLALFLFRWASNKWADVTPVLHIPLAPLGILISVILLIAAFLALFPTRKD